jgi:hypothetical protein
VVGLAGHEGLINVGAAVARLMCEGLDPMCEEQLLRNSSTGATCWQFRLNEAVAICVPRVEAESLHDAARIAAHRMRSDFLNATGARIFE